MAAILIPNWKFIVFLTIVYVISALMTLDPNVATPGGAIPIVVIPITSFDIVIFLGVLALALTASSVASSSFTVLGISYQGSKWSGGAAFVATILVGSTVTNTWAPLALLAAVVTFNNLGLPLWLQLSLAVPCTLLFVWTFMAFVSAVLGIGREVTG